MTVPAREVIADFIEEAFMPVPKRELALRAADSILRCLAIAGYQVAPHSPTEEQWGGLARDIIMWLDMCEAPTPRKLFEHLELVGRDIPQWLRDEPEMKTLDRVPSKGTRAAIIYKAMVAVPSPRSP